MFKDVSLWGSFHTFNYSIGVLPLPFLSRGLQEHLLMYLFGDTVYTETLVRAAFYGL